MSFGQLYILVFFAGGAWLLATSPRGIVGSMLVAKGTGFEHGARATTTGKAAATLTARNAVRRRNGGISDTTYVVA